MGGWRKEGGGKPHEWHPSQKGVLDSPSYGTVSTPLRCQCYVFPVQKSTTEQTRSSFWRGPKIFGRARSLVRFPPPIRFAPPHITAQSITLNACQHETQRMPKGGAKGTFHPGEVQIVLPIPPCKCPNPEELVRRGAHQKWLICAPSAKGDGKTWKMRMTSPAMTGLRCGLIQSIKWHRA